MIITYTTITDALYEEDKLDEVKSIFIQMLEEGLLPYAIAYSTIIDGFCKHGELSMDFKFLSEMKTRVVCLMSLDHLSRNIFNLNLQQT